LFVTLKLFAISTPPPFVQIIGFTNNRRLVRVVVLTVYTMEPSKLKVLESSLATEDMKSIYKRIPLHNENDTRLLRILPALSPDGTDTIACELEVVSMNPPPGYRALSYVWGDPEDIRVIQVQGEAFVVRINLWHFLTQMRKERDEGPFWIDAICINQSNDDERRQQVSMMGNIYRNASEVVVWLGPDDPRMVRGLERCISKDWMESYDQSIQTIENDEKRRNKSTVRKMRKDSSWTDEKTRDELEERTRLSRQKASIHLALKDYVRPFLELINNRYWSRVWVVQEFLLARALQIRCGSCSVDASALEKFDTHAREIASDNSSWPAQWRMLSGRSPAGYLLHWKRERSFPEDGSLNSFLDLVLSLGDRQCTDSRDRVYALLSLNECAGGNFTPDYKISVLQLFLDIVECVKAEIKKEREISSLCDKLERVCVVLQLDGKRPEVSAALKSIRAKGQEYETRYDST
jgi:hypothetical protein